MNRYLQISLLFYLLTFPCLEGGVRGINHRLSAHYVHDYELAAAMIFRDEAPYLKEWIEYHQLLGVERFYLYNNLSQDNYLEVLTPYINNGTVKLIEWSQESDGIPSWNAVQCLAYVNALQRAVSERVKWLIIADSDEFMVPIHENSLQSFLSKYENDELAAVRVLWVMFGTSHVAQVPSNKTMVETLTMNEGYVQGMWKSIVRPERVDFGIMGGCHTQYYLPMYHDIILPTTEIQCNHYWTRDENYLYNFKIPRRMIWGTPMEVCDLWKDCFNQDTPASRPILRFVPELRKRLGLQ